MLFPFGMSTNMRHFLYMAMLRYTSNSNTYISQTIPEYQNVAFLEAKNENILAGFISIHDKIHMSVELFSIKFETI